MTALMQLPLRVRYLADDFSRLVMRRKYPQFLYYRDTLVTVH